MFKEVDPSLENDGGIRQVVTDKFAGQVNHESFLLQKYAL
jgi:hypothetical protein